MEILLAGMARPRGKELFSSPAQAVARRGLWVSSSLASRGEKEDHGLCDEPCQGKNRPMLDVEVIDDPAAAAVALEPVRSRLLAELAEPASAATLSPRGSGSRARRSTTTCGRWRRTAWCRLAGERQWGGLTERLLVASAASYVVSPSALGAVGADPGREADRLSAGYLVALAARVIREVGALVRRAGEADKRLPTLSIDTEIRFRSAADRAAFSQRAAPRPSRISSPATTTLRPRRPHASSGGRGSPLAERTQNQGAVMSVKIEPSGRRSIQVEVEVPGTPEEVWQAIATGPGVSSWFVPTEIDGREGRRRLPFRPGHGLARDRDGLGPAPPVRRRERRPGAGRPGARHGVDRRGALRRHLRRPRGAQPVREHRRLGRPARERRVRLADFFRTLRLYLAHFRGQRCSNLQVMAMAPEPVSAAWETLTGGLGLAGVAPGQRWSAPAGAPPLAGVVEGRRRARTGTSRASASTSRRRDSPSSRCASAGEQVYVVICLYLYGDRGADAAARTSLCGRRG